jgi:hypothetical protein
MARPRKNNADYFPHDSGLRDDVRIKAVRRKFGHEGYSVWNMLTEKLCKCEFFSFKYDEINLELMAGDFDLETEKLKGIIDYFLLLKLIELKDECIFNQELITSLGPLFSKRERQRIELSLSETEFKKNFG